MLINAKKIIELNHKIILKNRALQLNIHVANAAIEAIKAAAYLQLESPQDITVLRLGIRLINSAGAGGYAALAGFYQPCAAHIRDIIEVSFLLDYFHRDITQIEKWRLATAKERRAEFRPKVIRDRLNKMDGKDRSYRDKAYADFSRHGTHAHPEGFALINISSHTAIGPFADEQRLFGLSYELALYLSSATVYLCQCIDVKKLDQKLKASINYAEHSVIFFKALEGFQNEYFKRP